MRLRERTPVQGMESSPQPDQPGEKEQEEKEQEEVEEEPLLVKRHVKYLQRVMGVLPYGAKSLDVNRVTILFFGICGLDILNSIDAIPSYEREQIIEWIYAQQILPNKSGESESFCGFRGGGFLGVPFDPNKASSPLPYDGCHVAMTYTALASLLILGDDLSRVNKPAILKSLRRLQLEDGSFLSTPRCGENDMRFIYAASCVCCILDDWSGMDTDKVVEYIQKSQGYDYGIGQGPCLESHGGSTFCATASLSLMGRLDSTFSPAQLNGLRKWCLWRQQTGFQGRPNKPVDTCYSFWVGASLELLGWSSFINRQWNRSYVLSTQGALVGGFSKWPDTHPDPMHTCLGLAGLSLNQEPGLNRLHPALTITQRAADWMNTLHQRWRET